MGGKSSSSSCLAIKATAASSSSSNPVFMLLSSAHSSHNVVTNLSLTGDASFKQVIHRPDNNQHQNRGMSWMSHVISLPLWRQVAVTAGDAAKMGSMTEDGCCRPTTSGSTTASSTSPHVVVDGSPPAATGLWLRPPGAHWQEDDLAHKAAAVQAPAVPAAAAAAETIQQQQSNNSSSTTTAAAGTSSSTSGFKACRCCGQSVSTCINDFCQRQKISSAAACHKQLLTPYAHHATCTVRPHTCPIHVTHGVITCHTRSYNMSRLHTTQHAFAGTLPHGTEHHPDTTCLSLSRRCEM